MKTSIRLVMLLLAITLGQQTKAQTYDTNNIAVQTFAGSGFSGYYDGQGVETMFNSPSAVVADPSGNLFVLDNQNRRIRKITPGGAVSTFAGGGSNQLPGYGTNITFSGYSFYAMGIDHSNALWIAVYAGSGGQYLFRIGADSYVSIIQPTANGIFSAVAVDSANNVYVADSFAHKIYRYRTNSIWEVFAGSGNPGSADGNGIFTSFNSPSALAVDSADNIYVWDSLNHLIRRINQSRDVQTIAGKIGNSANLDGVGTNASLSSMSGMCADAEGNVILACGSSIRKMTATTNVLTMAGSFNQTGYTNGVGIVARFRNATGVCVSQGKIFISDWEDHRIRNLVFDPEPQPVSGGKPQREYISRGANRRCSRPHLSNRIVNKRECVESGGDNASNEQPVPLD